MRRVAHGPETGESPTRMFRTAGLDPGLIGRKRIGRAYARWRDDPALLAPTRPGTVRRGRA